jgi:hypothetical protein
MPGSLGTDTNSPLIDGGTLLRQASPVRGSSGRPAGAMHIQAPGVSEAWKRFKTVREWWERVRGYSNPETRSDQFAKDAAELPFAFAEALGVELKMIPLVPMWKAELEFLIKVLQAANRAERKSALAAQEQREADRIAVELELKARQAVWEIRSPNGSVEVLEWNAIVRWHSRGRVLDGGGIFMGPGFMFHASSLHELNAVARTCRDGIYDRAAQAVLSYMTLRIQQIAIARLEGSSKSALDGMMQSKSAIAQIKGDLTAAQVTVERDGAPDASNVVATPMRELERLALQWAAAADTATHRGEIQ